MKTGVYKAWSRILNHEKAKKTRRTFHAAGQTDIGFTSLKMRA
ncbi:hypothetical protein [Allobaculum sp. JKK-2023]|nr:hypothetical protein [Allobaculum sp. JKK-2023]